MSNEAEALKFLVIERLDMSIKDKFARIYFGKLTGLTVFVLGFIIICSSGNGRTTEGQTIIGKYPSVEDYATIEAYVGKDETPVYAFGYTYIYGLSPDLQPGAVMQIGNNNPIVKFKPKKSWEIKSNLCGFTAAREPRTMWNDDQPLLPVHLIDGDPETAWASRYAGVPDREPAWIRIDLPMESVVSSVALVCSKKGPCKDPKLGIGKSLPRELEIKLSRDARNWETVYINKDLPACEVGSKVIEFQTRRAKQIWIIGNQLRLGEGASPWETLGYAFSLGEVEVRNPDGQNLALISRGAGVTVSSTYHGFAMNRYTHDMLWPTLYDLGAKWIRVGFDLGLMLWSYVEREKGVLKVDPKASAAIKEAHRNGINVILCLDKGNWLYHDPPRKVDWKKARTREMMETYHDHQGWPTDSPEMMAGYLRYVDYMVRHFSNAVAYYEIGNEWQGIPVDKYVELVRATIPVIKNAYPEAKIMLGSTGTVNHGMGIDSQAILACLGKAPDVGIIDGVFSAPDNTLVIKNGAGMSLRDAKISVNASSLSQAGIVLRYQDRKNYLLALYTGNSICFKEMVEGKFVPALVVQKVNGLESDITLSAKVNGSQAHLSVSDGKKTCSIRSTIQSFHESGFVGLFHEGLTVQRFDNFELTDSQGKRVYFEPFDGPNGLANGWSIVTGAISGGRLWKQVKADLASQIDAIGWHPCYQADPDSHAYRRYRQEVEKLKKDCEALGFRGVYSASEWTWVSPYPSAETAVYENSLEWCSEMSKAKYSAQFMTANAGLNVISLYNEAYMTDLIDWDCTLLRSAFQSDPISPPQPQAIYYVLRNANTVLDGFEPYNLKVRFRKENDFDYYTFRHENGRLLVAVWIPGRTEDGIVEVENDIILPGVSTQKARVIDIFNGTTQELILTPDTQNTILQQILIKDYPVFIEIQPKKSFYQGRKIDKRIENELKTFCQLAKGHSKTIDLVQTKYKPIIEKQTKTDTSSSNCLRSDGALHDCSKVYPARHKAVLPGNLVGWPSTWEVERRARFVRENQLLLNVNAKLDYIFIGNSLTHFWDLNRYFDRADVTMINRGLAGDIPANILSRFEADIIQIRPKYVHIWTGLNELFNAEMNEMGFDKDTGAVEAVPGTADIIRLLAEKAREAGIVPILASVTPITSIEYMKIPNRKIDEKTEIAINKAIPPLNLKIRQIAHQTGGIYVDYYSEVLDGSGFRMCYDLTDDGVHFNDAGCRKLTKILCATLSKYNATI